MDINLRIQNVLTCLCYNGFTLPTFVELILNSDSTPGSEAADARQSMMFNLTQICSALEQNDTSSSVSSWAFTVLQKELSREVNELSKIQSGLHFNAASLKTDYLEGSFMTKAADKMKKTAPQLWGLVGSLLDANSERRRVEAELGGDAGEEAPDQEGDLGELGGVDISMETEQNEERDGGDGGYLGPDRVGEDERDGNSSDSAMKKAKKRRRRAAQRNAALTIIKSVVVISIFLQNTNERCNYLQGILGVFYHSCAVPEKVIDTLAHAGLSISISSILNAVKSLSQDSSRKLRKAVQSLTTSLAYDNFDINFKTSEPTVEQQSTFVSATSATAIPLYGVEDPGVLRCSQKLWEKDPLNPSPAEQPNQIDVEDLEVFHKDSITRRRNGQSNLSRLRENFAWHVRDILVRRGEHFTHLKKQLGQPEPINQIPLHQTAQIPCRAMNIKESTPDGNIEVVECLLRQGGLGEPQQKGFDHNKDVDMSESVLIVHGDLLTKERLDSVKRSRRIEETPKRRFQFTVFVPGLFHFKMACADALWRTWAQPKNSRTDANSLFQHVGILRPGDTVKFGSKPGFRLTHDVIHHDAWASFLDCWRLEAQRRNHQWTSLSEFAKAKPTWELIVEMSEAIVEKYVATTPTLSVARRRPMRERDQVFENQVERNRDELLYLELSHAMNAGDIGRVESTFLPFIYLCKATGKHKYASQMARFMRHLRDVYPAELSHILRMNWLCNPTGKEHGFRGVDWLVERNNLYTKVIYSGSSSNRTIDHIISESPLIELYRECHVTVENGFHLEHRTIRHTHPDMTKTILKLRRQFEHHNAHSFKAGRKADTVICDQIAVGMDMVQKKQETIADMEDEPISVEGNDLMADH